MSKAISEVFDVEPYQKQLPTVVTPSPESAIESDADFAADNIRTLIAIGMESVKEAAAVAEQQESPRAYEVVSTMIKGLTDMNLQLLDIHSKKKELNKTEGGTQQSGSVNNTAIFVGTTQDLNKIIMDRLQNNVKT